MAKCKRLFRLALGAVVLFCIPLSVTAQDTGSHVKYFDPASKPTDKTMSESDKYRFILNQLATCVLKIKRRDVVAVLDLGYTEYGAIDGFRSMIDSRCLKGESIKLQPELFRGATYIALYREDFGKTEPESHLSQGPLRSWWGQNDTTRKANIFLLAFADCIVRSDYDNSRKLVMGPTAGKEEYAAFAELAPSFSPCMPKGADIKISKYTLFGLIAEALYLHASNSSKHISPPQ